MHIQRNRSRLFRTRQRRFGWLSVFVFLSLLLGMFGISRDKLEQLFGIVAPQENRTMLERAEQAFASGDLNTAINLTRQLLENEPDNVAAIQLLARALVYRSYSDYYRIIDRKSALDLTRNALRKTPKNPELLGIQAFVLQANNRSEEARRIALEVLKDNPENIPARIALALAYGGQGIFEASLREGERALELAIAHNPGWRMDAKRAIAIAYSDLGEYEKAIKMVDDAIALNEKLAPLQFERALYALQISDYHAATVSYYRTLAFDPENVKARLRMCELSSTLRNEATALDYCIQVTEMAPTWADGWYQLGREYFLQGEFKLAQEALNRCSTLQVRQNISPDERRFECWYIQGQAAEILGDCDALIEIYNEFQSVATSPDVLETWTYPPEGPSKCAPPPADQQEGIES